MSMYDIKKTLIITLISVGMLGPVFVFAAEATDCVCEGSGHKCYKAVATEADCAALCQGGSKVYGTSATVTGCVWSFIPGVNPAPVNPAPTGATSPETVKLTNPLKGDITDVPTLVGMLIKAALGLIGAVSLFVFIMGGFKWLTSLGNAEKVSKGAKTMLWAVLGLIITFASYLILNLLLKV